MFFMLHRKAHPKSPLLVALLFLGAGLHAQPATTPAPSPDTPPAPSSAPASEQAPTPHMLEPVRASERLRRYGEPTLAERRLRAAIEQQPTNIEAQYALALVYLEDLYQPSRAFEILGRLLVQEPKSQRFHLARARASLQLASASFGSTLAEEFAQGVALIEAARTHAAQAAVSGETRFLQGEIERMAMYLLPHDLKEGEKQGRIFLQTAQAFYRMAVEANPGHSDALLALAKMDIALDDGKDALKHLLAYEALNGVSLASTELRAEAALLATPPDLAAYRDATAQAVKEYPTLEGEVSASLAARAAAMADPGAGAELVRLLREVLASDDARRSAQMLAPWLPKEGADAAAIVPEFCYLMAAAEFATANHAVDAETRDAGFKRVLALLQYTESIEAAVPDVLRLRAVTYMRSQAYDLAATAFARLATLDPADTLASQYAAIMPELKAGNLRVEQFERLLDIRESEMILQERIKLMQGLVAEAPRFAAAQSALAWLLRELGQFPEALAGFDAALKVKPDYATALYGRMLTLVRLSRHEEAQAACKALMALDSGYREVQAWKRLLDRVEKGTITPAALESFLASEPQGLAEARRVELLEQALAASPTFFEALLARARLAARSEQAESGIEFARRAHASALDDEQRADALITLADAYRRCARHAEAGEAYAQARTLAGADEKQRASIAFLEAAVRRSAGEDKEVDQLMRMVMASGVQIEALRADPVALMYFARDAVVGEHAGLRVTPVVVAGSTLAMSGTLTVEVTGPALQSTSLGFDLELVFTATPADRGLYEFEVRMLRAGGGAQATPLADLQFSIQVSPWFGLIAQPLAEDHPAYLASLPVVQALVELFTIAPGTADARKPWHWANLGAVGVARLRNTHEACRVAQHDGAAIVLERVAIDDFADPADEAHTWSPRERIDAECVLEPSSRLPRSLRLSIARSRLTEARDDVVNTTAVVTLARR